MLEKKRTIIFLIIILVISSLLSFTIGHMKIELSELFDAYTQLVIFQFRLPRLLCAILVGGGMALAGHILQTVLQNDLADPGVIGINAGISFFVLLYVLVSGTVIFLDYVWMPMAGMIGAIVTISLLIFLVYEKECGIDPIRMTICGVALNLGFQGLILFFSTKLNRQKFSYVQLWNAGILTGTDWLKIILLAATLVIIGLILWKYQDVLNIFSLGKESAMTLGVDLKKQTIILISLAGFLAAFTIAFGGSIPFVGLIAPHIARRLVGSNHRYALWVSMLIGSLLVIIGDSLSRSLINSSEIPTGIILSLIGVPYFIYLLKKERR
ncbi:FecCD family ABC transporter permease [Thomasclavelia sp.]